MKYVNFDSFNSDISYIYIRFFSSSGFVGLRYSWSVERIGGGGYQFTERFARPVQFACGHNTGVIYMLSKSSCITR